METPKTTPPTAIELALDALRAAEDLFGKTDATSIFDGNLQLERANVLAQVAAAQALVALTNELRAARPGLEDIAAALLTIADGEAGNE